MIKVIFFLAQRGITMLSSRQETANMNAKPKQLAFAFAILRGKNKNATQIEIVSGMERTFFIIILIDFVAELNRVTAT